MKKIFLIFILSTTLAQDWQKDMFEKIKNYLKIEYLNPLAEDLSLLLNTANFHEATKLKLLGFDFSIKCPIIKISEKNKIIKETVGWELLTLPVIAAEVGLPFDLDLSIKGLQLYTATIIGGGIKYKLPIPEIPFLPNLIASIQANYTTLLHNLFRTDAYNINLMGSMKIPFVPLTPTIEVGYEATELKVQDLSSKYSNIRLEGGIGVTPFPIFYIYIGVGLSGNREFYNGSLGIRFS